nr:MAG TPA_asm: hypothetical protein [Caudoviricetes sp.]
MTLPINSTRYQCNRGGTMGENLTMETKAPR